MKIVIAQPSFFPWVGTFEKIRLADKYVHLDHVQFSKGSFTNRTKIRTADGCKWVAVPLSRLRFGQMICDVRIDMSQNWQHRHIAFLEQQYQSAPFKSDMLEIVAEVYNEEWSYISDLSVRTIHIVCKYFDIFPRNGFIRSSELSVNGHKSELVLNIVRYLNGSIYVCGSGGQPVQKRYLDHVAFEEAGIRVEYMQYQKNPYRQLYEPFIPNVSVLDLIANEGRAGRHVISSYSVYWKNFT
jgi:hypothetical protein